MKVAAIIVTHDREPDVVRRTLQSVIDQNHPLDDIILIDNGTQCNNDIKNWIDKNNHRIGYLYLPELSGPEARNHGASLTECEAICFLDDDDEWYPSKIQDQIQHLTKDVCLVSTPYVVEHSDHDSKFIPRNADMNNILGENILGSTSFVMLSKKVFDRVGGFDPRLKANQEWDLWMRMLLHGDSAISDGCAGIKHHSETSITMNHGKRRDGWRTLIRKHKYQYLRNPKAMLTAFNFYRNEMRSYGFVLDYIMGTLGCCVAYVLRYVIK